MTRDRVYPLSRPVSGRAPRAGWVTDEHAVAAAAMTEREAGRTKGWSQAGGGGRQMHGDAAGFVLISEEKHEPVGTRQGYAIDTQGTTTSQHAVGQDADLDAFLRVKIQRKSQVNHFLRSDKTISYEIYYVG